MRYLLWVAADGIIMIKRYKINLKILKGKDIFNEDFDNNERFQHFDYK